MGYIEVDSSHFVFYCEWIAGIDAEIGPARERAFHDDADAGRGSVQRPDAQEAHRRRRQGQDRERHRQPRPEKSRNPAGTET